MGVFAAITVFAVYVVVGAVLVGVLYTGLEQSPFFGFVSAGMFALGVVTASITAGPAVLSIEDALGWILFSFTACGGLSAGITVMLVCVEPEVGYSSQNRYKVELPEPETVQKWIDAVSQRNEK